MYCINTSNKFVVKNVHSVPISTYFVPTVCYLPYIQQDTTNLYPGIVNNRQFIVCVYA